MFQIHQMSSFSPVPLDKGIESCFSASLGAGGWVVMAWSASCCQERRVWRGGTSLLTCLASDAAGGGLSRGAHQRKAVWQVWFFDVKLHCKSPFSGFLNSRFCSLYILRCQVESEDCLKCFKDLSPQKLSPLLPLNLSTASFNSFFFSTIS